MSGSVFSKMGFKYAKCYAYVERVREIKNLFSYFL